MKTEVKLSHIENNLAESKGFECIKDEKRGFDWCRFEKAESQNHVWMTRSGWRTADLINGSFTNHKSFSTLEQALNRWN